jgi:uncharacterized protein (DUF2062 family)
MLFKRRRPLSIFSKLRSALWPRRGWGRSLRYAGHRLGRIPGTPYRIAAGFASGVAVSFTPLLGFHFVCGALLALLLRGSVVASAIGTAVGNPWTFPFIWAWIYGIGRWILGHTGGMPELPADLSFQYIFNNVWSVFWPMAVGGLPMSVLAWLLSYWPMRRVIDGYQKARRHRIERRRRQAGEGDDPATDRAI